MDDIKTTFEIKMDYPSNKKWISCDYEIEFLKQLNGFIYHICKLDKDDLEAVNSLIVERIKLLKGVEWKK